MDRHLRFQVSSEVYGVVRSESHSSLRPLNEDAISPPENNEKVIRIENAKSITFKGCNPANLDFLNILVSNQDRLQQRPRYRATSNQQAISIVGNEHVMVPSRSHKDQQSAHDASG